MDLFPLWNSLRIAAISSVIVFFTGIFAAYKVAKMPRIVKGILDVILTTQSSDELAGGRRGGSGGGFSADVPDGTGRL